MPHPVPLIIGTTLAVIGSGYAFKKFIYDPHLAPLIDALIAQHRDTRQREGYEPIPVPVHSPVRQTQQLPIPPTCGRSSAVDSGQHRVARRRRPAEMYELDDTRIVSEEQERPPPCRPYGYHQQPQYEHPPQYTYQPRQMKTRSVTVHRPNIALSSPASPPAQRPPVVQPTPLRVHPSPILVNMESVAAASEDNAHDENMTPLASRPTEVMVPGEKAGHALLDITALPPYPTEQVEEVTRVAKCDPGSSAISAMQIAPAAMARQISQSTISDHVLSPIPVSSTSSVSSGPVALVASPAPSSVSNLSHLSQISRISSASSPYRSESVIDDLDIISVVSGTTTSYVDAETYTPRSPASPRTPLSRTMSPPIHIDSAALGLAQPLSAANLSLATLSLPGPEVVVAPSVSSWGEDEQWRSDSEWDAVSDAGAR